MRKLLIQGRPKFEILVNNFVFYSTKIHAEVSKTDANAIRVKSEDIIKPTEDFVVRDEIWMQSAILNWEEL